jgi:UDP-GlcNAc3NAcA epimerase
MRLATIVGARPQFIKASAVSRQLRANPECTELLIHTGQHFDPEMSEIFFEELMIPRPDYDLGIGSGPHGAQTGRMLEAIESTLLAARPQLVLVYGDTNSTLAGALAAAKLHIPVAHVEAGLRSFDRRMPEEINRVVTDHLAEVLFAPTDAAVRNLLDEGIDRSRIHRVGDVMYDVALHSAEVARCQSAILDRLKLSPKTYILVTIHRAENTDDPARLCAILEGLVLVACECAVVLPLHPRTRSRLAGSDLLARLPPACRVLEPVGYHDMVVLEMNARLIATDSGGVQKEAFFHRVPCVTLRAVTEWTELVDLGWNHLVAPASATAVADGLRAGLRRPPGREATPYGDGAAAQRIVGMLKQSQSALISDRRSRRLVRDSPCGQSSSSLQGF